MNQIQTLLSFDDTFLIAHDNQRYPKIPYKSSLHEQLVYQLQDPEYAALILEAYETHIAPTLTTTEERASFEKAVVDTCLMFGSQEHGPQLALERTLRRNNFNYFGWRTQFPKALRAFIDATPTAAQPNTGPIRRVCILHTTASGGNSAVSRAMSAFLTTKGLDCHLVDVEEFAKQFDPMQRATGYSFDELYAEILQKQNKPNIQNGFPQFLRERVELNKKICQYIAPCTAQKVREKIAAIAPDIILSTRSYTFEDTQLAYRLNIPLRIVYCDWHLFIHVDQVGKTDPTLVKFWLPAITSRSFSYLLGTAYASTDNWKECALKIESLTQMSSQEIELSFEELGYPVGPEYCRITDRERLTKIRSSWGLSEGEKLVTVTMGKNGVGVMEELFSELIEPPKISLKYLFICGTNKTLYDKLRANCPAHILVTSQISHQEMSDVMNISSFMLSKPGGGASAQSHMMGVPMIIPFAHSLWEGGNQYELEKAKLAIAHNRDTPLSQQIEEAVSKQQGFTPTPMPNWQENLARFLKL